MLFLRLAVVEWVPAKTIIVLYIHKYLWYVQTKTWFLWCRQSLLTGFTSSHCTTLTPYLRLLVLCDRTPHELAQVTNKTSVSYMSFLKSVFTTDSQQRGPVSYKHISIRSGMTDQWGLNDLCADLVLPLIQKQITGKCIPFLVNYICQGRSYVLLNGV
jgi:hypothetical protein